MYFHLERFLGDSITGNLPKLQMYLALQLNLGNELVVENPV